MVGSVEPKDARVSFLGLVEAKQSPDEGGLAGPVRPEQANRLAASGHAKAAGDAFENLRPSEPNAQILKLDNRRHELGLLDVACACTLTDAA